MAIGNQLSFKPKLKICLGKRASFQIEFKGRKS